MWNFLLVLVVFLLQLKSDGETCQKKGRKFLQKQPIYLIQCLAWVTSQHFAANVMCQPNSPASRVWASDRKDVGRETERKRGRRRRQKHWDIEMRYMLSDWGKVKGGEKGGGKTGGREQEKRGWQKQQQHRTRNCWVIVRERQRLPTADAAVCLLTELYQGETVKSYRFLPACWDPDRGWCGQIAAA